MGHPHAHLGQTLFDIGLAASILLSLAALAMLCNRQPVRRLAIARAALIGSLALIPLIGFELLPRFPLADALQETRVWRHPLLDRPPARFPGRPPPLPRIVLGLYLAGTAIGLGWLAMGWAALGRLARQSVEPSPATDSLYASLPIARPQRRPRLRVAARVGSPVLVGLWRPTIVIPTELDQPEAQERLRLALLHELAHFETADPAFVLLGHLAECIWFPVLPIWWIRSQVRLDQEILADRRASASFGEVRDYASSLLEIATPEPLEAVQPNAPPPPGARPASAFFQRMLVLLRCPYVIEGRPPGWWLVLLVIAAAGLTLGLASISLQPTSAHRPRPTRWRQYRMSRLEVGPLPAGSNGRAPVFELPARLPPAYSLRVEVWGDPEALNQTRLAGLPLSIDDPPTIGPRWHLVEIHHDPVHTRLTIDGRPVTVPRDSAVPALWLSVEPAPDAPISLRTLELNWFDK